MINDRIDDEAMNYRCRHDMSNARGAKQWQSVLGRSPASNIRLKASHTSDS